MPVNRRLCLLGSILFLPLLVGCGGKKTVQDAKVASEFTAKDVRGKVVTLASAPKRIVSLTPANTEILFALGLGDRVVADTAYCDYPLEAKALPKVGDSNISVEKVIAQRPDLVVASASASGKVISSIERAGIPVFAVDPATIEQTCEAIKSIGQITGATGNANAVVTKMRLRIEAVADAVANQASKPRVLIVLQASPLWVAGTDNFMDELTTAAGGINVARDAGSGFHTYSPERVVALKPQIILAPINDAERIRQMGAWRSTPAVINNAIYSPNADRLNRPGPRLPDALEELAMLYHPSAFHKRP